jgi:hypothetical protein
VILGGVPAAYLVLFVADPARDAHADALRTAARGVPGAGFFDDPESGAQRTVGTYLRTDGLAVAAAARLVDAVAVVSAEHGVRVEVQWREEVLGWIDRGTPDTAVTRALGRDIPEPL